MSLSFKEKMQLSIHYDCDGVLRDFHNKAFEVFFEKYPEYKKYILPVSKFRGWRFEEQLKLGPDSKKIDALMWEELFNNEKMCFEAFGKANPLIYPDEWNKHIRKILCDFPDANIVISTHQYTDVAREATTYWLQKNGFTDEDNISILYTGKKTLFGAHYLLDDKPAMIEQFHKPYKSIGVLFLNPRTNGWYTRKIIEKKFLYAKNLNDYYKIINKTAMNLL